MAVEAEEMPARSTAMAPVRVDGPMSVLLREELAGDPEYQGLVSECRKRFTGVVESYWEIGKRISTFLAKGDRKSRYGKRIFQTLADDTGIEASTLYRSRQLFDGLPEKKMIGQFQELSWSRMRKLTPLLKTPEAREAVLEKASELREMSGEDFQAWLPGAYTKLLEKPYRPRGRKPGAKSSVKGRAMVPFRQLKTLAYQGRFSGALEPFPDGKGFFVALACRGGETPEEITATVERIIAEMRRD
ncbi:hypothetical protein HY634_03240 [Candidatus Uhrbacteria bacterium]|nr:hypothetical protein [Candidatus Uhrbacteria bacterium]